MSPHRLFFWLICTSLYSRVRRNTSKSVHCFPRKILLFAPYSRDIPGPSAGAGRNTRSLPERKGRLRDHSRRRQTYSSVLRDRLRSHEAVVQAHNLLDTGVTGIARAAGIGKGAFRQEPYILFLHNLLKICGNANDFLSCFSSVLHLTGPRPADLPYARAEECP